ncbi:MAG: hypothetical protein ACKPKO_54810 [Candidatus Fonsibacter sp.]
MSILLTSIKIQILRCIQTIYSFASDISHLSFRVPGTNSEIFELFRINIKRYLKKEKCRKPVRVFYIALTAQ